jgi:hypothetical protein
MPVALLNDDFISVSAVAADRHVGLAHAVLRACRSNASLVANFHGTSGAGQHARTSQDSCQDPYMALSHRWTPSVSPMIGNAISEVLFPKHPGSYDGN